MPNEPNDTNQTLGSLFRLFEEYLVTGDSRRRIALASEIRALFALLGFEADRPEVKSLVEAFERAQEQESLARIPTAPSVRSRAVSVTNGTIARLEHDMHVKLTGPARELIRIPVAEVAQIRGDINAKDLENSLRRIFQSLQKQDNAELENRGNRKTSIAVLRSIWENFCNIPPFCRGKEQQ